MKTISGMIISAKPVNLSKANNILVKFVISDNGATQAVSAYLCRASIAFNEHVCFKKHHKLKKNRPKEETSTISDISQGMVIGNGGRANMQFDQDPVQIDSNETVKEKREEKKKKMKRKRKVEVDAGVIVVMPKKKKNES